MNLTGQETIINQHVRGGLLRIEGAKNPDNIFADKIERVGFGLERESYSDF